MASASLLGVLTILLGSHCALGYGETTVFVSKKPGVNGHQFTSQAGGGSFTQITGENAAPGEISFFTGYSQEEEVEDGESWGSTKYCNFHKALNIFRKRDSWVMSESYDIRGGFQRTFTVYVADSPCEQVPTVKVYYATCSLGGNGRIFGRVGKQRDLCGSFTRVSEGSFYAKDAGLRCKALGEIQGGYPTATYNDGRISSYKYQCQLGYKLQGNPVIHCQSNGRWSGQPPSCNTVKCRPLDPPQNGRLDTSITTYGTRVHYICDRGYEFQGSPTQCQDNGQWIQTDMSCEPVDCGYPPTPNNGDVQRGLKTTFGSRAIFSCYDGYALQGAKEAVCEATKSWKYLGSNDRPSCRKIQCPNVAHPLHGSAVGTDLSVGAQRTFTCNNGYNLVGEATVICERDGDTAKWSGPVPTCTVMNCPPPKAPENGQVLGRDYRYGKSVNYICNLGYKLLGGDRSTCQTTGWDGEVPSCKAITCRDPGVPENGKRSGDVFSAGALIAFTCNAGYTRQGAETITCQEDGTWSARKPECNPVSCPAIRAPRYGSRDGDVFEFPAKLKSSCFPGYEMEGDAETQCQADGTWSKPVPECKACPIGYYRESGSGKECQKCPPNSSTVTTASSSKDHCTCNPGSTGPQGGPCTVVECESLIAPENGNISDCGTSQSSECTFSCNAGYILSGGSASRRCTADGWTGSPAVCTACPANSYKMHANAHSCTPCPQNTVTTEGQPADSRDACKCAPGFRGQNGGPCEDINECEVNKGGCNQHCENTVGSFTCSCTIPGYELDDDGKTCLRKQSCPELDQSPGNGFLNCKYTESTNGKICFIRCLDGFFFVSGKNNYVTCGQPTMFKWSHRVVNATARIPACTREFFVDVELPISLVYSGSGRCGAMTKDNLKPRLETAVNNAAACNNKCEIKDFDITCAAKNGRAEYKVAFDIFLKNVHPSEQVPLECKSTCKRSNLRQMLRNTFTMMNQVKALVNTQGSSFQLPGPDAPVVDASSFSNDKPQLLCDPGKVLTKNRLCVPCDKGYFLKRRDDTECTPCPKGTYQDEQGHVSCKACLPGSSTLDVGSDHPTQCSERVTLSDVSDGEGPDNDSVDDVTEDTAEAVLDSVL